MLVLLAAFAAAQYPPLYAVPPEDPQWTALYGAGVSNTAPRPQGSVPNDWSGAVLRCSSASDWGLTYDDGPSTLTPKLLSALKQKGLKTTFFVVGSRVAENRQILREAYNDGHQIGIHTWSHPYLSSIPTGQVISEIMWTARIIKDTIGVVPKFMRPPYGDMDARVNQIIRNMGLTPVIWSKDSGDSGANPNNVVANFRGWMGQKSADISLEHDLFAVQVDQAVSVLDLVQAGGYTVRPVAQCLGMSLSQAYSRDITRGPPLSVPQQIVTSTTTATTTHSSTSATAAPTTVESLAAKPSATAAANSADRLQALGLLSILLL
ncbi:hypothetical protein EDD86DRAFT_227408 [Gorgonomyces haynaldii]|nr:hypothetical protein EDD86DRAFT_227408 [Gorgonomyces haynaldii]